MMWWIYAALMNNLDTALKRVLINTVFGVSILLILALAVLFRYYIDMQHQQLKHKQQVERTYNIK